MQVAPLVFVYGAAISESTLLLLKSQLVSSSTAGLQAVGTQEDPKTVFLSKALQECSKIWPLAADVGAKTVKPSTARDAYGQSPETCRSKITNEYQVSLPPRRAKDVAYIALGDFCCRRGANGFTEQ